MGPLKIVHQPQHLSKWSSRAWTRWIFIRDGHKRSPDRCLALTSPGKSLRCFRLFTASGYTLRIIPSQPKWQGLIWLRELCQTLQNNSQMTPTTRANTVFINSKCTRLKPSSLGTEGKDGTSAPLTQIQGVSLGGCRYKSQSH